MTDSFDSIPSEYFFEEVKKRFGFLTNYYRFSISSEKVNRDFHFPTISYSFKDFYLSFSRSRGSYVRVSAGIQNKERKIGFGFGEICYYLDSGNLPSERIYGYGPNISWDNPIEQYISKQLNWYAEYLKKNLDRVLDLFFDDANEEKREYLIVLKRDKIAKL